jgi:REP element-mobilizing transposase RayT
MLIQDYQLADLSFAYCYHAYLRWSTHRLQPHEPLARINQAVLAELASPLGIHLLGCNGSATEVRLLVSLKPDESISSCASKLKGKTSRWLREALRFSEPANLLSKGYFACTSGKSTTEKVNEYLNGQGEHHGYTARALPPIFVQTYTPTAATEAGVQANHAFTRLQFHLVLATYRRRGVFGRDEARAVAGSWRELQAEVRFVLTKVSFVPDHAHVAVCLHPSVSPGGLAVSLMNRAQKVIFDNWPNAVITAGVERLWQPSAYVGSFGDLASPQIQSYIQNWKAGCAKE